MSDLLRARNPLLRGAQNIHKAKTKDRPTEKVSEYAALAEASYARERRGKQKQLNKHAKNIRKHSKAEDIGNFIVDTDLKLGPHTTVYKNTKDNRIVVAYRGTQVSDFSDMSTDLAIALGAENISKRFRKHKRDFQNITAHYGDDKDYVVVGHSLGGSIASFITNEFDDVSEAHVFNPGSGISSLRERVSSKDSSDLNNRLHRHFMVGDPISYLGHTNAGVNDHVYTVPGVFNHSIHNFM